jgi:hypothetical protein
MGWGTVAFLNLQIVYTFTAPPAVARARACTDKNP